MQEDQSDSASRRRFLKAFVAAGSGLAVAPNVAADQNVERTAAPDAPQAEACVTLEA